MAPYYRLTELNGLDPVCTGSLEPQSQDHVRKWRKIIFQKDLSGMSVDSVRLNTRLLIASYLESNDYVMHSRQCGVVVVVNVPSLPHHYFDKIGVEPNMLLVLFFNTIFRILSG